MSSGKEIVNAIGGDVDIVTSKPGLTVFRVTMPVSIERNDSIENDSACDIMKKVVQVGSIELNQLVTRHLSHIRIDELQQYSFGIRCSAINRSNILEENKSQSLE